MKIVRAPLRVSLVGGGTDFPSFYREHGCVILSLAIDRYMYLTWAPRPTGGCRLSYSKVEELDTFAEAEHTLVRAFAQQYGIDEPGTLTIVSDVPKGTGLGSSSALAVCLTRLCGASERSQMNIATTAYHVERDVTGCGAQDHLPAAFGGYRCYNFREEGWVSYHTATAGMVQEIDEHGLLLYTGRSRRAADLFPSWKQSTERLMEIRSIAEEVKGRFLDLTICELGAYLDAGFRAKAAIPDVVDEALLDQYEAAKEAGVIGGKLLGAGGGGCWFFLVRRELRQAVVDRLGLIEIPFRVADRGVEVFEI